MTNNNWCAFGSCRSNCCLSNLPAGGGDDFHAFFIIPLEYGINIRAAEPDDGTREDEGRLQGACVGVSRWCDPHLCIPSLTILPRCQNQHKGKVDVKNATQGL